MLKILSILKDAFHRPQAIMRWIRIDKVEQRKQEGWKIVKGKIAIAKGDLVLMRKG